MTTLGLIFGIVVAIAVGLCASRIGAAIGREAGYDEYACRFRAFFPGAALGFLMAYSLCEPGPATADSLTVEPMPVIQGERLRIKLNGLKYDDTPRLFILDIGEMRPPTVDFGWFPGDVDFRDQSLRMQGLGQRTDPYCLDGIDVEKNVLPIGSHTLVAEINFLGKITRVPLKVDVKPASTTKQSLP